MHQGGMTAMMLVILFMGAFMSSVIEANNDLVVELLPRQLLVASSETLIVNCTVKSMYNELFNESDIIFQHSSWFRDTHYSFHGRTVQLHISNVQRNMSGGWVSCHLKHNSIIANNSTVIVADYPDVSQEPNCISYDCKNMTCSWMEHDVGIPTTYELKYHDKWTANMNSCTKITGNLCNLTHFRCILYYCVRLVGSNALGTRTSAWTVKIDNIVKPSTDALQGIVVQNLTATTATIYWERPIELCSGSVLCLIDYSSDCTSETSINQNFSDKRHRLVLENLIPFMVYSVRVKCKMQKCGLWSDPIRLEFRTTADVPRMNPSVLMDTFSTVSQTQYLCAVEVFWQLIERCDYFDAATNVTFTVFYHVADRPSSNLTVDAVLTSSDWSSVTFERDRVSGTLLLDPALRYEAVVVAKNSVGFSHSLPLMPLYISRSDDRPRLNFSLVVLRNNSEVTVQWPSDAADYVIDRVYWCKAPATSRCQTALESVSTDSHASSVTLHVKNPEMFRFAVRAKFFSTTTSSEFSDLLWSTCVYDVNLAIQMPHNVRVSNFGLIESLLVEWSEPSCARTGYVSGYIIHYCYQSGTSCIDDKWLHVTAPSTKAQLENLKWSASYSIRIMSSSPTANSTYTNVVSELVNGEEKNRPWYHSYWIVGGIAAVGVVFVVVPVILAIWKCYKCLRAPIIIKPPRNCHSVTGNAKGSPMKHKCGSSRSCDSDDDSQNFTRFLVECDSIGKRQVSTDVESLAGD